jgi:parallel beta-helix repeat protein
LFLSRAFARQNIAVLGADGAAIAGVTITNPHNRGYGLWLESTSPVVADNSFINNTHDGVSVKGNSRALIRNNYFAGNGTNGISVYSNARPEVRENVFEKTGFGIVIAQNSAPLVVGNLLVQNTDGIVINGRAQPILRGNTIEESSRDGLVAAGEARPDIGTTAQAGGNQFRNNRRYDINTTAISQTISAVGNQITRSRLAGRLDLGNGDILVTQQRSTAVSAVPTGVNPSQPAQPRNSSTSVEIPVPAPRTTASTRRSSRATSRRQRRANRRRRAYRRRFARRVARRPIARRVTTPPVARRQPIPLPPVARRQPIPLPPIVGRQPIPLPPVARTTSVVIPVPPPARPARTTPPISLPPAMPLPSTATTLPPIPQRQALPMIVPIAPRRDRLPDVGVEPGMVPESGARLLMESGNSAAVETQTPSNAVAVRLQYRVLVLIENEQQEQLVRELVPNPIVLPIEGRRVLQVGEFSDRLEAEETMERMNRNNLSATIEEF